MKKIFLFIVLFLPLLCSCSNNNGERPIITVDSVYVDGKKEMNIAQAFPKDSRIDVFATLKAVKGNTLSAFNVKLDCGDNCPLVTVNYDESVGGIIDDNPSKPEYSIRFNDGVVKTKVQITTYLFPDDEHKFKLNLYLNNTDNNEEEATKVELTFAVSDK